MKAVRLIKHRFPTWGTYCKDGNAGLGRAVTSSFKLQGPLRIFLSGNPNAQDINLWLQNVTDNQRLRFRPSIGPSAYWMDYDFAIPASWLGKDLRIVAEDQSVAAMGWVGFSGPYEADKHELYGDAKKILLKTPMYLLLLVLPGFCLAAIAAWRGVTGTLKLGLIVLAGIAFPGYLVFFTTIALASLVQVVSPGLPYVFGAVLVVILIVLKPAQRRMLLPLLVPTGQVLFVSMFILSLGYLQGGTRTPNGTATVRFSHPLPSDNSIPYIFAEDLLEGPVPRPMLSDWLSSDRPPLQTGMILALRPWTAGSTIWLPGGVHSHSKPLGFCALVAAAQLSSFPSHQFTDHRDHLRKRVCHCEQLLCLAQFAGSGLFTGIRNATAILRPIF